MTTQLTHGASGALRRFAGWVARGSIGHPLLDGIDYWDDLRDSPSQMETLFAVFANVLDLDDGGEPVNEKYAERRAAVWVYRYCTGRWPEGEPPWRVGKSSSTDAPGYGSWPRVWRAYDETQ